MTAIHNGTSGENYYAKPSPVAAGAWDADDIALVVNPNLSSQFTFENDPTVAYDIYRRAGVSPANTDEIVATVPVSAQAAAAAAIEEAGLATVQDVQVTVEPDITINPTELSQESIDGIRDGLATSEEVAENNSRPVVVCIPLAEAESLGAEGGKLTRYRGTDWRIAISELGAIPAKCYFTLKRNDEPDADAVLQIVKTTPTDAGDGLKILNGATASTPAQGAITFESYVESTVTKYRAIATIAAEATATIKVRDYRFDFKDTAIGAILHEQELRAIAPVTSAT